MIYNLGRVVPLFKGNYDAATTYGFLDVVYYDNSSFVALDTTTGNLPTDTSHWLPVALKGTTQNPTQAQMQQIISEVETYMHSTDFVYDADYTHIDVIDNHTSTSTTNALSANQGKVLYDLIDDVNHEVDELTNNVSTLVVNNLTTDDGTKALSAKQGRILDLLLSHKKNTFTDLTAVQKISGVFRYDGVNVSGTYYYHTEPIHLNSGECVIYRGYTYSSLIKIFNYVESDGTFIKPVDNIKCKQLNSEDYSRNNTSIFTATEECYVSVNLYTPNENDWYLCKSVIGVLYDVWNKFKLVDSTLSSNTESINNLAKQLNTFNFVPKYYINNSGVYDSTVNDKYHADSTYYELGDIIKIDNVSMANNFPIIAFYDSNKTYLSKINSIPSININITSSDYPENAVYCRLAYYGTVQPFINLGYSTSLYQMNLTDESLQTQIDTLSSEIDNTMINYLADGESLFVNGHYISYSNGTEQSNSDYSCTDFLKIPIRKDIRLIHCQTGNPYMAAIAFYNSNQTFISALKSLTSSQVGDATITTEQIPENAKFIRVSGVIITTSNKSKVDYSVSIKESVEELQDDVIGLSNTDISLSNRITALENAEESVKTIKFKAFNGNSSLEPNNIITLLSNKVRVNSILTSVIEGTIEQVDLGVGYSSGSAGRTYDARWIELTQTQVKVYGYYNNGNVLHQTYNHGLTLTNRTTIYVITGVSNTEAEPTTKLQISTDDGYIWTQEITWGQGIAFVQNKNTNGNLTVSLRFMPRDITNNVWVFGDSYFSYWPKYLYALGLNCWLRNSQPGSSPDAGYSELQHLLSLGYKPSYVLWCLGMNGDTSESMVDGHYVINSYQKTNIDNVKALCESYDITPVFMAIPTVPTRKKTGFRTYLQSLNVRFVDTYKAVGADEYGIWHGKPTLRAWTNGNNTVYTQIMGDGHAFVAVNDKVFNADGNYINYQVSAVGESNSSITVSEIVYNRDSSNDISGLLSSDGIHPTAIGGKVIAYSVLAEFPEIGIME